MIQELFPFEWNGDMTHQLKRNQLSSSVPLYAANVQENVVGVLAMLKSSFIASFPDKIKPIRIRVRYIRLLSETLVAAFGPSISNELHHQFLDFQGQVVVTTS